MGADFLAFYQTGAFQPKEESHTVTWFAPVQRYRLLTRAELLPDEADHPRSQDYYFRIDIGPLKRLDHPIPAATFRRVTFIHTTLERLLHAQDITELRRDDGPFDALWQALRDNRLRSLPNRLVGDWPADIALRARNGYLGIRYSDEAEHCAGCAPPGSLVSAAGGPRTDCWGSTRLSAPHCRRTDRYGRRAGYGGWPSAEDRVRWTLQRMQTTADSMCRHRARISTDERNTTPPADFGQSRRKQSVPAQIRCSLLYQAQSVPVYIRCSLFRTASADKRRDAPRPGERPP